MLVRHRDRNRGAGIEKPRQRMRRGQSDRVKDNGDRGTEIAEIEGQGLKDRNRGAGIEKPRQSE